MDIFFRILLNVILPVFLLLGVGVFLHRKFHFDMNTLSKLNTYFLMPAVSFVNIYQNKIGGETLLHILGFLILQCVSLMGLSAGIAKVARFDNRLSSVFKNSIVLNNSGNFGLPVSQLVFHQNPLGASIQIVVMIFQNLLTYTYGLLNSVSVDKNKVKAMKEFFKNPVIYVFLLGLLLHALHIKMEGEVALIIGKRGKNIKEDEALDYVFGYTIFNDVTARDLTKTDPQFTRGKGFDTFGPLGPWIVTGLDPTNLKIVTTLNDKVVQDGNTNQMSFSIPYLISWISQVMTLEPGDVLATGSPSGSCPMKSGDVVSVEVENIGKLRNYVK